jgi:hypothetical protein
VDQLVVCGDRDASGKDNGLEIVAGAVLILPDGYPQQGKQNPQHFFIAVYQQRQQIYYIYQNC